MQAETGISFDFVAVNTANSFSYRFWYFTVHFTEVRRVALA
jgi:hypothetical protein